MNFIRLNGRTFTISEVNLPTIDAAMLAVQTVQERRVAAITENIRQEFVNEAFQLDSQEVAEITRLAQRNEVAVPTAKHALPLVILQNKVCPLRAIDYAPNKIYGSLYYWQYRLPTSGSIVGQAFWAWVAEKLGYDPWNDANGMRINNSAEHKLVVTGMPPPMNRKRVYYTICGDMMLCSSGTYHTMSAMQQSAGASVTWYKMCIGTTTAPDYWAHGMADFIKITNQVNMDSLAYTSVTFDGGARTIDDLCKQFLNVQVQHIRPGEGWSA